MLIERTIRGQTIRVECSNANARRAENVLDAFEKLAISGTPLQAGTQIRFGWSLLRLTNNGNGLRVAEPDFATWPQEHWNQTIDTSLDVLAAQITLLHQLGVDGADVFFDQVLLAAPGALEHPQIFLRRDAGISAEDSGWSLAKIQDPEALTSSEGLERVLIAHLVSRRRALLQTLVLPPGFMVVFSGDLLEQVFDPAGHVWTPET